MANSKRRCTKCKTYEPIQNGVTTPLGFFCSHLCKLNYVIDSGNKLRIKAVAEKIDDKYNKGNLRDLNSKSLKWQHSRTQPVFNKMRRLEELLWFAERGLEPTCISCGKELGGDQWSCGHKKTQGGNSRLAYDPQNTWLQHNRRCNQELSADIAGTSNTHGYDQGLINRFGELNGRKIIDYCEQNTGPKKWTCDELQDLRKQCNATIRLLERKLAA
jgi:hypothetical protein